MNCFQAYVYDNPMLGLWETCLST